MTHREHVEFDGCSCLLLAAFVLLVTVVVLVGAAL